MSVLTNGDRLMTILEEAKYIMSNIQNNNNKFWYIELNDDRTVVTRNGRVGNKGVSRSKSFHSSFSAQDFFDKKCIEKERKGYVELNVVDKKVETPISISNIKNIARKQIKTNNNIVKDLIDYFSKVNAHNIFSATGGKIKYNTSTGSFSTPLGIVTLKNILEANRLLGSISHKVSDNEYDLELEHLTNNYMMLIPMNVGMRRVDVSSLWDTLASVQYQKNIVDSLYASLTQVTSIEVDEDEVIFDVKLNVVNDPTIIDEIKRLYNNNKNKKHSSSRLKVKKVYSVRIGSAQKEFINYGMKVGNVKKLWHGTKASNVLSILKQGLVVPRASSSHCTGRMYGDGLYFSDQSTKALNYSTGYWDGVRDDNCFMFLCSVALGKQYTPTGSRYGVSYPKMGYDSTFAKAGLSGVLNNEMIVYKTSQCNLEYLVEFS